MRKTGLKTESFLKQRRESGIKGESNCQTVYPREKQQREAAAEAVRQVGLNQIREIDEEIFKEAPEWKEMFFQRLEELKKYER